MPVAFTRSEIEALAALAHLELDAAEIDLFNRQLSGILDYARQVQEIDTAGVPPTESVAARLDADRADDVRPSLPRHEALENAPEPALEAGLFKVPRVIG